MNKCKGFSKIWFLGLLLVAFVAGCANNGGDPGTLVSIKVAPASTSIPVTGVVQYSALAIYGDGSARDVTGASAWTSGSPGVATILPSGVATGVVAGQATITAVYGGKSATAALTVNAATSKGLKVTPAVASIPVTGTQQYTLIETFSDGTTFDRTEASTTWTSGSPGVATIVQSGVATGVTAGQTTITAVYNGKSATAALTVNAATSKGLKLTPAVASIPVTGTQQYTLIETFSDGTTFDRTEASTTWTSGSPGVATIVQSGVATGNAAGQATITVVYNGKSATAALTVNAATSKGLKVTPALASIPVTGTQKYTLIETFSDGTTFDRTLDSTWSAPAVSGSGVASILPSGLATGNAVGQATITALYQGKTATANLTVVAAASVSFTVTPATTTIPVTGTRQYKALETFSDGTTIDRTAASTWTAPDLTGNGVASFLAPVLNPGLATGNAAGQATITAKYTGANLVTKTATANLTVVAATSVSFTVTPATTTIPVAGTRQYKALETFSDGTTIDRTADSAWTAPDLIGNGVASFLAPVLNPGLATGNAAGQATITAKYTGANLVTKTATATLTVTAAITSVSFTVTPATTSIPVTGTKQYSAIETFSDGTTINRTAASVWTAPDLNGVGVASILSTGIATGTAAGQATITAKFSGRTATAVLTVTAVTSESFSVAPVTTSIKVAGTRQFTAIETFSDGSTIDRTLASDWTSVAVPPAVGVATIGLNTGIATGVAEGQSTIKATYGLKSSTATLTVTASTVPPATVPLGLAATFGAFGGSAGMTNQGTLTIINGDIGTIATATSMVTGFHDTEGDIFTETGSNIGQVNGTIFTCTISTTGPNNTVVNAPYCAKATQARLDAQTAYVALGNMPSDGVLAGNLAGTTIYPGVYTNSSSVLIEGGDLTLDAQGDANAIFVFQIGSTLTVGGPGAAFPSSIILAGNAQAKNVFWKIGTFATINAGGGGTMVGTIIANSGVSFSTAGRVDLVTLNGRALSLVSSVTMVNTKINVPAP